MECPAVHIRASSRLHFGLFSFGGSGRQFGGVGVMVQQPSLDLAITAASAFKLEGLVDDRIWKNVEIWMGAHGLVDPPSCSIQVKSAPPAHAGLGSGTQLALSMAAGLSAITGRPVLPASELARAMGRAHRSAVGTYGFVHGGFVVEAGRLPDETLAPLLHHQDIPDQWRFVLVRLTTSLGLFGDDERRAFSSLPPVTADVRDYLKREVDQRMIPAIARGDCEAFGESVYQYGRAAGNCFAELQGGPYNGPELNAMVQEIRGLGIRGVGQSSWGPTLFAIVPGQESAERLRHALLERHAEEDLEIEITRGANCGATLCRG